MNCPFFLTMMGVVMVAKECMDDSLLRNRGGKPLIRRICPSLVMVEVLQVDPSCVMVRGESLG